MKVLVIDGQGGKMGKAIVEKLLEKAPGVDITAVGTNTAATSAMIKAGASQGATGENPVVVNAADAQIIVGPIGIMAADALHGEITPKIALAVSRSKAVKVLIPMGKCNVHIAGIPDMSVSEYIARAVDMVCQKVKEQSNKP